MKGYKITVDSLNIRSGPGVNYEIVGSAGRDLTITEVNHDKWLPVELDDNSIGWLSKRFLEEIELPENTPVLPVVGIVKGIDVVKMAMTQNGDPYILGVEVDLYDPNPEAFDCSELVQWVCHQLGIEPEMPDGAIYQMQHCENNNSIISVEQAVRSPGALLFRISSNGNHVVISRGDGSTIEAKGSAYGVGVFNTAGRDWSHGAFIPGVKYA